MSDYLEFLIIKSCAALSAELHRELTDRERELVERLAREIFEGGQHENTILPTD